MYIKEKERDATSMMDSGYAMTPVILWSVVVR